MLEKDHLQKLIKLRKELHLNPELSEMEHNTIKRIIDFMRFYSPHKVITEIGKTGAAFIYNGIEKGNTVVIRCDLDALPINETNELEYTSKNKGVSHVCGHDGHMTIVAGLAKHFNDHKPKKGKVVLLFQPAEETGQGAKMLLADKKFMEIEPDYIFGLHNLPGFEKKQIVIGKNSFSSASVGMILKLKGYTSHASEPEKGNSPASAMSKIIEKYTKIGITNNYPSGTFATVIYARLGEIAFGTSPGYAEVMTTIRSGDQENYEKITAKCLEIAKNITKEHELSYEIEWVEEFAATENDGDCVRLIEAAAKSNNYDIKYLDQAFRWSEDFGFYTQVFKGAMFGLGSGIDQPALHNSNYDFPDDIIEPGIEMFLNIIKQSL